MLNLMLRRTDLELVAALKNQEVQRVPDHHPTVDLAQDLRGQDHAPGLVLTQDQARDRVLGRDQDRVHRQDHPAGDQEAPAEDRSAAEELEVVVEAVITDLGLDHRGLDVAITLTALPIVEVLYLDILIAEEVALVRLGGDHHPPGEEDGSHQDLQIDEEGLLLIRLNEDDLHPRTAADIAVLDHRPIWEDPCHREDITRQEVIWNPWVGYVTMLILMICIDRFRP